jgi:predicted nucleic acid-binding protein
MIVADASAVIEVLLNTAAGTGIARRLFATEETVHVPHILDLEVLQTLRKYVRTDLMDVLRAEQARQNYTDMPLSRYSHTVLMPRIWALRHNWTAYDAAYIALAEALAAPLITCDRGMASPGHTAKVILV